MASFYFTIAQPVALWLLFAVPLLIFTHLYFMRHARHRAIIFGNFTTIERVTGKRLLTKNLGLLVLRLIIIVSLIFAAAGTTLWHIGTRAQNDVVILIDSSASMSINDMNGTRLAAARIAAGTFLDQIDSRTEVGLIQYSGLPEVLQVPTSDDALVRKALASVALKPLGGSDIAAAIVTGTNLLADKRSGRAMVLLTDGVSALSLYDDNPIPQAISYARQRGVVIHTIGVGSERLGSFVPGLEAKVVMYDEENLRTIAANTGGTYAWAHDPVTLKAAFEQVIGARESAYVPIDLSSAMLLIAIALLFVEWGLLNTRFRLLP